VQAHGDARHGAQRERPSVRRGGRARRSKQRVRLRRRCHVSLLLFSSEVSEPPRPMRGDRTPPAYVNMIYLKFTHNGCTSAEACLSGKAICHARFRSFTCAAWDNSAKGTEVGVPSKRC
jgi:hypothetical protein